VPVDAAPGQPGTALVQAREGLELFTELGESWGLIGALLAVAACLAEHDVLGAAAQLAGAAEAHGRTIGAVAGVLPHWQAESEFVRRLTLARLGKFQFEHAWAAGTQMPIRDAIRYGLAHSAAVLSRGTRPSGVVSRTAAVTGRERQVLGLVAEGLTNRQIAERLIISEATVKRHLEHVFGKLGVSSRAAAVRAAARPSH
jgi:DNA-binding CsgD family transcriptional regulator